jgi:hypothetical protein
VRGADHLCDELGAVGSPSRRTGRRGLGALERR